MRRFYLDLVSAGETIPDEIGVEAGGREEIAVEVHAVIAQMEEEGSLCVFAGEWTIVARGEDGSEVQRFPVNRFFKEDREEKTRCH